jgi:C1A family cysteine protease
MGKVSKLGYKLNWVPARPVHNEKVMFKVQGQTLPPLVDNRQFCPPIVDQGQIGSCSANAAAACFDYLQLKELTAKAAIEPEVYDPSKFESSARLLIYYDERAIEGDVDQDGGVSTLRNACLALQNQGACPESLWAYDVSQFAVKPSDEAYAEAAKHKISQYAALTSAYDMKCHLSEGFIFMMGITVFSSFESDEAIATGNIPMPSESDQEEGGHAIAVVGYDDTRQVWICRNSWGTSVMDKGYFYLPYAFSWIDDQYCVTL